MAFTNFKFTCFSLIILCYTKSVIPLQNYCNVTVAVVEYLGQDPEPSTVWKTCKQAAQAAELLIVPLGLLSQCDKDAQGATSVAVGRPIVSACGSDHNYEVVVTSDKGEVVLHIDEESTYGNASAILQLTSSTDDSNLTIGISLGSAVWDPLQPRELMLHGAELIISLPPRESLLVSHLENGSNVAMLLTRGFENVAAVLQAVAGPMDESLNAMSTLANWCNDMLPLGCPDGSRTLPMTLGTDGVAKASFSLCDLRLQRATGIWGDAFRRPFTYQPLCGIGPSSESLHANSGIPTHSNSNSDAQPFKVKVAMLQMKACYNQSSCLAELEKQLRNASAMGVDIVVTPEMWSMGYAAQWNASSVPVDQPSILQSAFEWTGLAETLDGTYISSLKQIAAELNIAVAAGMMLQHDGASHATSLWPPQNSVVLIDRHGHIGYAYSKVHTCDWSTEEALTTPGREWMTATIDTAGGNVTVGSMICADREFPESARTLAAHGAELILTPNACGLVDAQLNQFATRAIENVVGVAMANYAKSKSCCNGRSVAYGHNGSCLAGPADGNETILTAIFDISAIRASRVSSWGQERLSQLTTRLHRPKLCELHRHPAFQRQNAYGRVAGSVV